MFQRHPVAATPSTGARSESYEARNRLFDPLPGRFSREKYYVRRKEDYVMTNDEVEALIKTKTRNKVRIHRLEERVGDSVAFLSYSIDDKKPDDDLAHRDPTIAATHGHWRKARRRGCPIGLA